MSIYDSEQDFRFFDTTVEKVKTFLQQSTNIFKEKFGGSWERHHIIPPEESWPLPFRQTSKHKHIPDFVSGRYGELFISQAFRELIEEFDPVQHHYIPLHLYLADGRESVGEYFVFKFGSFVDGIIAEKSKVGPMYDRQGNLGFYSTGHSPKITWRADAVEGRHVWADTYLKDRFFCSDEFLAEVEKRKMKVFDKTESFVCFNEGKA